MLKINDTIIVEVRRDNTPPPPPIPTTTPLGGVGGDFFAVRPNVFRTFMINNVDYSEYVTRWPTIKNQWDDARPRNLRIQLSNEEQRLNYFFSDRRLLNSSCSLVLGHENISAIEVSSGGMVEHGMSGVLSGDVSIAFYAAIHSGHGDGLKHEFWRSKHEDQTSYGLVSIAKTSSNDFEVAYQPYGGGTTTLNIPDGTYSFLPGRFHHVGVTVCSGYLAVYQDNALIGSYSNGQFISIYNQEGHAYIGANESEGNFRLSDLRVYNDELDNIDYAWMMAGSGGGTISPYLAIHLPFQNTMDVLYPPGNHNPGRIIGDVIYALGPTPGRRVDYTVFRGKLDTLTYKDGGVNIELVDKFHVLNETTIGTQNSADQYTGWLPSTIVRDVLVNKAGLDFATYVDSESFYQWAEVFSSNNVIVSARFTGQTPTEILREMAQLTQSAIYINHGDTDTKLHFNLFASLGSATLEFNDETTLDSKVKLSTDEVINYQYVYADWDETSNYYKTEVLARDTLSAGYYGVKEDKQKSNLVWYYGSASALYYADRSIAMYSAPPVRFDILTGLAGIYASISDTVIIEDRLLEPSGGNVGGGYRVMGRSVNLDDGTVKIEAMEAGALFSAPQFRLDYSALDGEDILL